jgi:hypothetical protein
MRELRGWKSGTISSVQHGRSLALQTVHNFLSIFRLDSRLFQGIAKVLQEQVEVGIVETVISGPAMSFVNISAGMDSSTEEHRNEHNLAGPEVRHVYSFKEMAQIVIVLNFAVEEFRSSLDGATSPDQFVEVFSHGASINHQSMATITNHTATISLDARPLLA